VFNALYVKDGPVPLRLAGLDPQTPDVAQFLSVYKGELRQFFFSQAQNHSLGVTDQSQKSAVFADRYAVTYNNQFGQQFLYVEPYIPPRPSEAPPELDDLYKKKPFFFIQLTSIGFSIQTPEDEEDNTYSGLDIRAGRDELVESDSKVEYNEGVSIPFNVSFLGSPIDRDSTMSERWEPTRAWFGKAGAIGLDIGYKDIEKTGQKTPPAISSLRMGGERIVLKNTDVIALSVNYTQDGPEIFVNDTQYKPKNPQPLRDFVVGNVFYFGGAVLVTASMRYQSCGLYKVLYYIDEDSEEPVYELEPLDVQEGWSLSEAPFVWGSYSYVCDVNNSGDECFMAVWSYTSDEDYRDPDSSWRENSQLLVYKLSTNTDDEIVAEPEFRPFALVPVTDQNYLFDDASVGNYAGQFEQTRPSGTVYTAAVSATTTGSAGSVRDVYLTAYYVDDEFHTVSIELDFSNSGNSYTSSITQQRDTIAAPYSVFESVITPASGSFTGKVVFTDPRYEDIPISGSGSCSEIKISYTNFLKALVSGTGDEFLWQVQASGSKSFSYNVVCFEVFQPKLGYLAYQKGYIGATHTYSPNPALLSAGYVFGQPTFFYEFVFELIAFASDYPIDQNLLPVRETVARDFSIEWVTQFPDGRVTTEPESEFATDETLRGIWLPLPAPQVFGPTGQYSASFGAMRNLADLENVGVLGSVVWQGRNLLRFNDGTIPADPVGSPRGRAGDFWYGLYGEFWYTQLRPNQYNPGRATGLGKFPYCAISSNRGCIYSVSKYPWGSDNEEFRGTHERSELEGKPTGVFKGKTAAIPVYQDPETPSDGVVPFVGP
jgi:hypothetical protein